MKISPSESTGVSEQFKWTKSASMMAPSKSSRRNWQVLGLLHVAYAGTKLLYQLEPKPAASMAWDSTIILVVWNLSRTF